MKKVIPILYFLVGLAFICQAAGLIPLESDLSRWFPLIIGWCFIILGVVWYARGKKSKEEPSQEPSVEETPAAETIPEAETSAAPEDAQ